MNIEALLAVAGEAVDLIATSKLTATPVIERENNWLYFPLLGFEVRKDGKECRPCSIKATRDAQER
jgi:hypothetical protein